MAPIAQWTDFIALARMDSEASDDRSSFARDMLAAMGNYMESRFGTRNVELLADLIMSDGVRGAIVGGIAAQQTAQGNLQTAVAAVVAAVGG